MRLITQQPEDSITETWEWETDIITSDDGTEQRICLTPLPKRTIDEQLAFDDVRDVRSMMTTMLAGYKDILLVPFWQYAVRIDAAALANTSTLQFKRHRAELRVGQQAMLVKRNGTRELVVVASLGAGGCTLAAPITAVAPAGARLVPVWPMYAATVASLRRANPDHSATFQMTAKDARFMDPFHDPAYATPLTMFNGIPVLEQRATGDSFEQGADTGATWTDYGGVAEVRSRWKHSQYVFGRTFLCNRVLEYPVWEFWRTFADYAKGSQNPFYLSTDREDFEVQVAPTPGGTTLTLDGTDYADEFWPHAPFKSLAIRTDGGVHYATVTSVSKVSGDSVLTFTPALPADAVWSQEQKVSLLMKVRISDDKLVLVHGPLQTMVNVNLRTVDE